MLDILQFIFSSFEVWLGTMLLCVVIFDGLGNMFTRVTQVVKKETDDSTNN